MYLLGHTDPTLTLAVYQQVLDMGNGSVELLEQTLGCTLANARAVYNGETTAARDPRSEPRTCPGAVSGTQSVQRTDGDERARGEPGFRNESGTKRPKTSSPASSENGPSGNKKPRLCGAFLKAAEGTRTLDLLHGKQTL